MKKILFLLTFSFLLSFANFVFAEQNYRLEKILILSRHNLRAPLVGKNSQISQLTSKNWKNWQVNAGELSLKGGLLETSMGQYFRFYLENENFFEKNYKPKANEIRFYANSFQRTIATAKNFSAGIFPVANINVEYKFAVNESDNVFLASQEKNFDEKYYKNFYQEKEKSGGEEFLKKKLANYAKTTEKVLDFKNSPYAKKNKIQNFTDEDFKLGNNPYVEGNLRLAMSASDAILMEYYEEKNIFGKKISEKELKNLAEVNYFGINLMYEWQTWSRAHIKPMLKLICEELQEKNRKFTFLCGHDVTLAMVLSSLGVEKFELPESIEKMSPLGAKLVIEKRIGDDGKIYAKINLVYQSTKQIEDVEVLDLKNPPKKFELKFKNMRANEDGLYLYSDFEKVLTEAIEE